KNAPASGSGRGGVCCWGVSLGGFGIGQQLRDGGHHRAEVLQLGGDDDLGGLAVGHFGQGVQAAQGDHLAVRVGLVQQPDGGGLGRGSRVALWLDGVGRRDGGLFFAFGGGDGGLLFALGLEDDGPLFTLGLHLLLHGVLDLGGGHDVLDLHPVDLDAPLVGGLV